MRNADKLSIKVNGEALINRTYRIHKEVGLNPIIVTGHEHSRFNALLQSTSVQFVHNADFNKGQHTSVLAGLTALPDTFDAVVISLADMPMLTADDLHKLMRAYTDRPAPCSAVIPFNGESRGNPVIINTALIMRIAQETGNVRKYLDSHPHLIHWYCNTSNGYFIDLDTPEDLETLQSVYGINVEGHR